MRTTFNIDDEVLSVVKKYAEERAISLGQAASDLIQRGVASLPAFQVKNGWVTFELPRETSLSNATVAEFEVIVADEEFQRALSPRR